MPFAARWPIPPCDLVVSMSHCVAKAAQPPAGVPHVCYCFTPMRYAWHLLRILFWRPLWGSQIRFDRSPARLIREWDRRTADRVTHFVAISRTIKERIAECCGRDSVVIYPPVDTDFYAGLPSGSCFGARKARVEAEPLLALRAPRQSAREDFYLVVSAFAPYKRIDLAIEACQRLNRRLVIIARQDAARLRTWRGRTSRFSAGNPMR
jgi:glycosyltransferase involved in cell wall biosynthesis